MLSTLMFNICLHGLIWYGLFKSVKTQSTVVTGWSSGTNVLPNNDEWTVYGYSTSVDPNLVHVFGGIKFPNQHYAFNLKSQAVNHFNNVNVPMNCHVQPATLNTNVFFMNDKDTIFYSIDLISFAVNKLVTQPSRPVQHVCVTQNKTHLFMLGGLDSATQAGTTNTQVYDINGKRWLNVAVPRMLQARFDFSCGIDPNNGRLYAIGGQVTSNTFTAQIEFISTTDIVSSKWRKFKVSLSTPMALYNNAMVPTIIAEANRRRLLVHDVSSARTRTFVVEGGSKRKIVSINSNDKENEKRRMQSASNACDSAVDTIFVVDESCGSIANDECALFKQHLRKLIGFYNPSPRTRFSIIGYGSYNSLIGATPTYVYLNLPQGSNAGSINQAINNLNCGNGTAAPQRNLQSGLDRALQMFSNNDINNAKSMIVYPFCQVTVNNGPNGYVCQTTPQSNIQLSNVTAAVYVSGDSTTASYYDCVVTKSKSAKSSAGSGSYFFNNFGFSSSQYTSDAGTLANLLCPRTVPSPPPTLVPPPVLPPSQVPPPVLPPSQVPPPVLPPSQVPPPVLPPSQVPPPVLPPSQVPPPVLPPSQVPPPVLPPSQIPPPGLPPSQVPPPVLPPSQVPPPVLPPSQIPPPGLPPFSLPPSQLPPPSFPSRTPTRMQPPVPPSLTLPPAPSPSTSPLQKIYNFVQLIIAGGYTGQCCPPHNPDCNGDCSNPNTVWSVNVTEDRTDLLNPCYAARYYNNSDIECGVVDTTQSMPEGRQGARLIYFDCDDNGPTLWIFGGRESDITNASNKFYDSNHVKETYNTCPVQSTPSPIQPCPTTISSSSDSDSKPWWKSLFSGSSSSSSSSDDNSFLHFQREHEHHGHHWHN